MAASGHRGAPMTFSADWARIRSTGRIATISAITDFIPVRQSSSRWPCVCDSQTKCNLIRPPLPTTNVAGIGNIQESCIPFRLERGERLLGSTAGHSISRGQARSRRGRGQSIIKVSNERYVRGSRQTALDDHPHSEQSQRKVGTITGQETRPRQRYSGRPPP